jgi:toxin ParE1/3/4
MEKFKLSTIAKNDIDELFEDGTNKFGKTQAIKYLVNLNSYFNVLAKNPETGKNRDEIKEGLVSFPYVSHIIFYRIFKTHIRIIRVLYGGRDLVKFL